MGTKTAGLLTLDEHTGLRLYQRVQWRERAGVKQLEGVLVSISRPSLKARFRFTVKYSDGEVVDYRRQDLVHSQFADFPEARTPEAQSKVYIPWGAHQWVIDPNYRLVTRAGTPIAFCQFCLVTRVYDSLSNSKPCKGPARISLQGRIVYPSYPVKHSFEYILV